MTLQTQIRRWGSIVKDLTYFSAPKDSITDEYAPDKGRTEEKNLAAAQLISSKVGAPWANSDLHKIAIDIDYPAVLVPSSTEGHSHLLIDHEIPWDRYKAILEALGHAGVLQQGYVAASIERGRTDLRAPWIQKQKYQIDPLEHADPDAEQRGLAYFAHAIEIDTESLPAVKPAEPKKISWPELVAEAPESPKLSSWYDDF